MSSLEDGRQDVLPVHFMYQMGINLSDAESLMGSCQGFLHIMLSGELTAVYLIFAVPAHLTVSYASNSLH